MAIQRNAENPGESLVLDAPVKYSLKKTERTTKKTDDVIPTAAQLSVKSDIVKTVIVFVILTIIIGILAIKLH